MDTLAPLAQLSRTQAALVENTFYPCGMGPRQTPDRVIAARLHGAASRLAGWNPPVGAARAKAVAELRDLATVHPTPRRGAIQQPVPILRADLLAEVAGLLLGTAPADHPQAHRAAAELLVEAGASRGLLDHWIGVGRARAARAECALADPAPAQRWP